MCRQTSVLNKITFTLFVFGCVAAALSFSAPFWVNIPSSLAGLGLYEQTTYHGLWGTCCADPQQSTGYACTWVWDGYYDMSDSNVVPCSWVHAKNILSDLSAPAEIPGWYKAAEIVFCIAIGFLFIAIVLQSIYNCCRCCKNPTCFPTVVGSAAIAGALLIGLSLGLYGGFSYRDGVFTPVLSGGQGGKLEWAFYVGIAAAATCFVAAIMFFIDGCLQTKHYKGYKSPALGTQ